MEPLVHLRSFRRYAWFVLGFNVLVILWGVFLRASKSGDGCGQHWLTCGGEVFPIAPELKTSIEFFHRITSATDGLLMIGLFVWALLIWRRHRSSLTTNIFAASALSLLFVLIEGALGAGLVLTGNTAETLTPERPFWMAAHLLNTLILLAFVTATAWFATTGKRLQRSEPTAWVAAGGILLILVGMAGSIAALASMIFPSGTLTEGLAKDMSETSHLILRLRPLHPILGIGAAIFFVYWTGMLRKDPTSLSPEAHRWAKWLSILAVVQVAFGALTLFMLAPILMQLGHLLLADAIWILFILLGLELNSGERQAIARE